LRARDGDAGARRERQGEEQVSEVLEHVLPVLRGDVVVAFPSLRTGPIPGARRRSIFAIHIRYQDMGDYWFTTLSAVRRGDSGWEAVAAYEPPVRRFLDERFAYLPAQDRDDLTQEILLAMRERLVAGYDAQKGPFRPFLRTAIRNRVRDHLRRRKAPLRASGAVGATGGPDPLDALPAPDPDPLDGESRDAAIDGDGASDEDAAAIEFEAAVVRAVRAFHDARAGGAGRDRTALYVLSGALVHGLPSKAIAERERLSADQVKRHLQAARDEILSGVLASLLPPGAEAARIARAADLARSCLREPRREARLLEEEPDAEAREAVAAFLGRLRRAGAGPARGAEGAAGLDFLRGVRAVFEAT